MPGRKRANRSSPSRRRPQSLAEDDPWLLTRIRESINSGLAVVDREGHIVSFNKAAEEITGYRRDEVKGRPLTEAFDPSNREILEAELARPASVLENREITMTTRSGDRIPIGYTVSPLVDERGKRLGNILIFKDLTDIMALREEIRQREHFATLGEMTASIAHEIRNPLAAMHTAAETLKEELGYDEDKEEFLNIILHEVKRVNALVSDFFTYVRPLSLEPEPLKVHELLDVLVLIEGAKMKKSGVALSCRFYPRPLRVSGARNLLQQALLNILLNAHQASPASGEIVVKTELIRHPAGSPVVAISIADQGPGIQPEALSKIFEPFFSSKIKGIGLGLPITQRIIKAMGGRIEVESTPGQGATFTILLPALIEPEDTMG